MKTFPLTIQLQNVHKGCGKVDRQYFSSLLNDKLEQYALEIAP